MVSSCQKSPAAGLCQALHHRVLGSFGFSGRVWQPALEYGVVMNGTVLSCEMIGCGDFTYHTTFEELQSNNNLIGLPFLCHHLTLSEIPFFSLCIPGPSVSV